MNVLMNVCDLSLLYMQHFGILMIDITNQKYCTQGGYILLCQKHTVIQSNAPTLEVS